MPKRTKDASDAPRGAAPQPLASRIPWLAVLLSAVVLVSSTVGIFPIRDARTFETVPEAHLARSPGYSLIAPISDVLDTLTLVSRNQDIALVVGALLLLVLWRVFVAVRRGSTMRAHAMTVTTFLLAVVLLYGAAAILPRPMASLETDDVTLLVVDFHSHTSASHDGRGGFDAARSRDWHAAGGFDVAYVTDHSTVRQAEEGTARNPVPAADGTTLLQGIETGWNGEHVAVLGAERSFKGILTSDLANVDTASLRLASSIRGREPVVVWNHPRDLTHLRAFTDSAPVGVRAIEIANGDPSAIDRLRVLHDSINAFADRSNIALTAGTDNHGWGRAAPNWTLMQIDGWRSLSGDQLEAVIEKALREGGYGVTRPIERVVATPASRPALLASVVTIPWTMLRTLSTEERVAWLAWIWVVTAAAWVVRRRRARA